MSWKWKRKRENNFYWYCNCTISLHQLQSHTATKAGERENFPCHWYFVQSFWLMARQVEWENQRNSIEIFFFKWNFLFHDSISSLFALDWEFFASNQKEWNEFDYTIVVKFHYNIPLPNCQGKRERESFCVSTNLHSCKVSPTVFILRWYFNSQRKNVIRFFSLFRFSIE